MNPETSGYVPLFTRTTRPSNLYSTSKFLDKLMNGFGDQLANMDKIVLMDGDQTLKQLYNLIDQFDQHINLPFHIIFTVNKNHKLNPSIYNLNWLSIVLTEIKSQSADVSILSQAATLMYLWHTKQKTPEIIIVTSDLIGDSLQSELVGQRLKVKLLKSNIYVGEYLETNTETLNDAEIPLIPPSPYSIVTTISKYPQLIQIKELLSQRKNVPMGVIGKLGTPSPELLSILGLKDHKWSYVVDHPAVNAFLNASYDKLQQNIKLDTVLSREEQLRRF